MVGVGVPVILDDCGLVPTLTTIFTGVFAMVSAPSISVLVSLGQRPTAEMIWRLDGGLLASHQGMLLCDRAALRPGIPPKNIRNRFQVICDDADQTLVAFFRSRFEAEQFLFRR